MVFALRPNRYELCCDTQPNGNEQAMVDFIITYNRRTGESRITQYQDSAQAIKERLRREADISNPDIEMAHISAPSLESLKKSHSRYFMGKVELDYEMTDTS